MKIVETYSHLNGLEFLLVHKKKLWKEIKEVITLIDAFSCRNKISKEKTVAGKVLFNPKEMNRSFHENFSGLDWKESRVDYWVTNDEKLIRKTISLSEDEQKHLIIQAGKEQFTVTTRRILLKTEWLWRFSLESTRLWHTIFL